MSESVPSKRAAIQMTPEEIDGYLAEQKVLNVATIGPSGHPHVVAMWYEVIDGKVTFWTFGKSQKILNLRRDPKMTGLVESGESYNELKGVELVGTGRIVEDYEDVLAIGKAIGVKYNGTAAISDAALPFLEAQARKRLGVVFEVERNVSWDHSKLSGGY
jgi:Pyridoxamine 5'-phosphate oxidase